MAYQPLARKYRPANFADLVGQDSVAKALANSIALGREPHAVIFAGVRGIGKTTLARIYAKALNCEAPEAGEPCGKCSSCLAISAGHHEDVLEIDGASNTGVDDVRALRETVGYLPQRSAFKVYIIDEVHMLSQSAFNALLKTLEEPPENVVFVFATTELQRIPHTIVSRCQTFHLQRFTIKQIFDRLSDILQREGIECEDKALAIVAKEGHGSMRDSLTMLDQVIALGDGRVVMAGLEGLVSHVSSGMYLDLLEAVVAREAKRLPAIMDQFDQQGASFEQVVEELAKFTRHAFIVRDLGPEALDVKLLGLDSGELTTLQGIGQQASAFDLNRIFRTLSQCRQDLDGSVMDRFILENYLFEWCFDPGLPLLDDVLAGKTALKASPSTVPPSAQERAPRASLASVREDIKRQAATAAPAKKSAAPPSAPSPTEPESAEETRTLPASWRELVNAWKKLKPLQARVLEEAYLVTYSPDLIEVCVDQQSHAASKLLQDGAQQKVAAAFAQMFAFTGRFVVKERRTEKPASDESLLDVKKREKLEAQHALMEKAKNDPFTQEVLTSLKGKIGEVVLE